MGDYDKMKKVYQASSKILEKIGNLLQKNKRIKKK